MIYSNSRTHQRILTGYFHLGVHSSYCLLFLANLLATCSSDASTCNMRDLYHEDLYLKPLQDGKLFAQFEFKTLYRGDLTDLRWENKIQILPLSISDLVATTDLERLHFSLTKGNWDNQNWGYSIRPSPPGAQIRVKFQRHDASTSRSWKKLINSLAGKFCASLTAENYEVLTLSQLSFGELYASLPEESVCTGNLTPWKKLLPCYTSSGLGSLLNAVNLLKSSFISMAVDLEPIRTINDEGKRQVQLTQTIMIVFNPLNLFEGKQTWSLSKIFGSSLKRVCPVADHSLVHIDVTRQNDIANLYPVNRSREQRVNLRQTNDLSSERRFATFNLKDLLANSSSNSLSIDIGVKQSQLFKRPAASTRANPPVKFTTHIAGVGASDGAVVATIINSHDGSVKVTYMDVIPHFLRIYLHTLSILTHTGQELKPDKVNYVLAKDKSSTLIEFSIVIPALTRVRISYEFERAFLRWTEFRADANKGVLLGSASLKISFPIGLDHLIFPIQALAHNASVYDPEIYDEDFGIQLYARPLLIILPTPDFSMPYNVICLVCTVIVAAFGPIHSATTRRSVVRVNKESLKTDSPKVTTSRQ